MLRTRIIAFTLSFTLVVLFYMIKEFDSQLTQNNDFVSYSGGRQLLSIINKINCTPKAIDNFPSDLFTPEQRKSGAIILHFLIVLYMFVGLAIVCDDYFVPSLELICENLKLQPDVAGATFMAAGSSAPELATTMIGVFIAKDDIGLGAVVGSADYNLMLVIGLSALCAKTQIDLNWYPLFRDCSFYSISIVILAVVIYDSKVYWYETSIMLIFYGLYILLNYFNPVLERKAKQFLLYYFPSCSLNRLVGTISSDNLLEPRLVGFGAGSCNYQTMDSKQQNDSSSMNLDINQSNNKPLDNNNNMEDDVPGFMHSDDEDNLEDRDLQLSNTDSSIKFSRIRNSKVRECHHACFQKLEWTTTNEYVTCDGNSSNSNNDNNNSSEALPIHMKPRQLLIIRLKQLGNIVCWPLRLMLSLTTPNCSTVMFRRWFWITFIMSCFWIAFYSYIMIWLIAIIGDTLSIPDTVMGLTFIAAGSSVPDAIASVIVVREGQGDMAVSNAVGSNVFDILICMGLPWLLKSVISGAPIDVYSKGLLYATATLFLTVFSLILITHLYKWRMSRSYGVILICIYVVFLVICSMYELNVFGKFHLPECT